MSNPEAELAAHVISWLESEGWDVYQEVRGVDIVALRTGVTWTVECKTILSFKVLEQAVSRIPECHCAWVATPPRKESRALVAKVCSSLGVGWITVSKDGKVNVLRRPAFNRRATDVLAKAVRPEHKTFARAGSSTGRSWTPFKETCRELVALVVREPGITLKAALKHIKHHYKTDSSAHRSLSKYLLSGVVKGVSASPAAGGVVLHSRPVLVVSTGTRRR